MLSLGVVDCGAGDAACCYRSRWEAADGADYRLCKAVVRRMRLPAAVEAVSTCLSGRAFPVGEVGADGEDVGMTWARHV